MSLASILPERPGRRYTVFCGTTSWAEWRAIASGLFTGPGSDAVESFERAAATATGRAHAVAFGAGRMALYALLEALGLAPGDEVILPGFTCAVVPNAIVYRGLRPVYADIEPRTFNIDPASAEALLTPRTRVLYAQHTFGVACDIAALRRIAERRGLFLIEDLAHSLGARVGAAPHGSLGDAGFFSVDRTKIINAHIGGCAVTSDAALARRLRAVRDAAGNLGALTSARITLSLLAEHALTQPDVFWLGRPALGALRRLGLRFAWTDESADTRPTSHPFPCPLPPAQCRIAAMQLARLGENLRHRRDAARTLEAALGWFGPALTPTFDEHAWLRYSFLVRDRGAFEARFRRRFELGTWFTHPIFGRERTAEAVGYRPGSCPVAERCAAHIVNFPTHARVPVRFLRRLLDEHAGWIRSALLRAE